VLQTTDREAGPWGPSSSVHRVHRVVARRSLAAVHRAAGLRSRLAAEAVLRTLAAAVGRPSARPCLAADHQSHLVVAVRRSLAAVLRQIHRGVVRVVRAAVRRIHQAAVRAVLRIHQVVLPAAVRVALRIHPVVVVAVLRIHQVVVLPAVGRAAVRIRPQAAVLRILVRVAAAVHLAGQADAACHPSRSWSCRRQLAEPLRGSPSAS
jgi:hypothetical protein